MAGADLIPRRAGWVLAGTLALTLLALAVLVDPYSGAIRLEVDPADDRLLSEDDEDRRFYDRVRDLFGSDDQLVVALVTDDVFTTEALARLARLTERIRALDGVREALSIATAQNVRGVEGGLEIAPFLQTLPRSPEDLEELRRQRGAAGAEQPHPAEVGSLGSAVDLGEQPPVHGRHAEKAGRLAAG